MTAERLDDKLFGYLSALCNGTLDAEESAQLDAWVVSDPAARRSYNNYLFLHAALYAEHASAEGVSNCELQLFDCGIPEEASYSADRRSKFSFWLAIAAALIGVAAVSSWVTYSATRDGAGRSLAASRNERVPPDSPAGAEESAVAQITATRNCLWQAATRGVGFGSRLEPGQHLELAAGLVEITFDDGAAIVLEGPANFQVQARGQAHLHEGRLAAIVPPRAAGFQVATSQVNVVDVGTEFGLVADDEGATEIHVFNGLVKAQLLDERGNQVNLVELTTSEGARIQRAAAMVARIPARDEEFVRSLSATPGPHDGLLSYDGFNYPAGPLEDQNGGFGWAGPWFNVEVEAPLDDHSNRVALGNLDYEGLVPLGNRAVQTAHQNRVRRALGTSVGGVFDSAGLVENQDGMRLVGRDGTTVYVSFLQRVDKPGDVFYGVELHRSDGNPNRVLCVGHGAEGTGYGVTSNFNVYGQRNYPPLGHETAEANFFVVRIRFGTDNRDRVEVIRNPESLTDEKVCIVDGELVGNFAFDRISLGNFHGTKIHEVDEIRVGTTFRAVTGRRMRAPDRLMPQVALWKQVLPTAAAPRPMFAEVAPW